MSQHISTPGRQWTSRLRLVERAFGPQPTSSTRPAVFRRMNARRPRISRDTVRWNFLLFEKDVARTQRLLVAWRQSRCGVELDPALNFPMGRPQSDRHASFAELWTRGFAHRFATVDGSRQPLYPIMDRPLNAAGPVVAIEAGVEATRHARKGDRQVRSLLNTPQ